MADESEWNRHSEILINDVCAAWQLPLLPKGNVAQKLADFASSNGCDGLVVGFTGKSKMHDFLLGTATEELVLISKVALLIAH